MAELPGSIYVRDVGLSAADDQAVWNFAAQYGLTIVAKDADFQQSALLYGYPPKAIWIRLGNRTTVTIAALLQARQSDALAFEAEALASFFVLS